MSEQSEPAQVAIERGTDGLTITIAGEIDLANVDRVASQVSEAIAPPRTTVDMTAVRYIDSSGVRLLMDLARSCEAVGSTFDVRVAKDGMVARVISLAELGRVITIREG